MKAEPKQLRRTTCKIVSPEQLEETKDKLTYLGYKIVSVTKTSSGDYMIKGIEKTYRVARRAICEC